jgi:hypothetical protein
MKPGWCRIINYSLKKYYLYWSLITLLIITSYIPIFTLDYVRIINITDEDHFYENSQAIFLLLSACIMLFLFIRSKSEGKIYFLKTERNYFFLLFFLFFFLCFGEEISWGERIFIYKTPEFLQRINAQKEINIHNLWILQSYDNNDVQKTGIRSWMTSSRLFSFFWLLYCVIIPILDFLSPGIHRIIKKINLPIIPLWIGSLFVFAFIIQKIVEKLWLFENSQPVSEIKETGFYFLYFVVCISFYVTYKKEVSSKG